jgi:hypothetical protein
LQNGIPVTNQTHSGDQPKGIGHGNPRRQAWPWVTSRPAGIGHGKAWRQAGVVLSFAAWPAGWASPSRRGRGVGLLWAVVRCSACTDLRKEKKKKKKIVLSLYIKFLLIKKKFSVDL